MGGTLVFQAPCPTYHPLEYEGELLWVPRAAGQPPHEGIPCLLLQKPRASHFLVYFHANAEDLGRVRKLAKLLVAHLGVHVLAVEYPGYGVCSGTPTEQNLLDDAEVVMDFVVRHLEVPLNRLLTMGRSVGGVPAIFLASKYECAGLVTMATFSSLRLVVQSFIGWGGLFPESFDNLTRIRSVKCPVLLIHGTEDETVEMDQARQLADACGADTKDRSCTHLSLRVGVNHNDFDPMTDIVGPIVQAFPDLRRGRPLALRAAGSLLRRRAERLAPDVQERVPYSVDYVPPVQVEPRAAFRGEKVLRARVEEPEEQGHVVFV
mmetsp:Transcript_35775/g.102828  ORF Transcript_35775/g.102828 Transcript_35775/m.102828 type:complete len:320 (+) Transcript_35775:48-1007(+)